MNSGGGEGQDVAPCAVGDEQGRTGYGSEAPRAGLLGG